MKQAFVVLMCLASLFAKGHNGNSLKKIRFTLVVIDTLESSINNFSRDGLRNSAGIRVKETSYKNNVYTYSELEPGVYYFAPILRRTYKTTHFEPAPHHQNNYYYSIRLYHSDSIVIDTFYSPTLVRTSQNYPGLLSYFEDGKGALNGSYKDTFSNGNLRIRGNFRNGQPYDSLWLFYPNGILQEITYYDTITGELYSKRWYPDGSLHLILKGKVNLNKDTLHAEEKKQFRIQLRVAPTIDSFTYRPTYNKYELSIYDQFGKLNYYAYEDNKVIKHITWTQSTVYSETLTYDSLYHRKDSSFYSGHILSETIKYIDSIDVSKSIQLKYKNGIPEKKEVTVYKKHKTITRKYEFINRKWLLITKSWTKTTR